MAVLHFAYSFDANVLAQRLHALSTVSLSEQIAKLQREAQAAVHHPSKSLQEALVAVRHSRNWENDDSEESDQAAKRFLICLLEKCVIVPSLGRQHEPPHHLVLQTLLTEAEWSSSDVRQLIEGEPLSGFLNENGLHSLLPLLSGLDDRGGWLGHERATRFLAKLSKTKSNFIEGGHYSTKLAQIVPGWAEQADSIVRQAYLRAEAMLHEVNYPNRALFLVRD